MAEAGSLSAPSARSASTLTEPDALAGARDGALISDESLARLVRIARHAGAAIMPYYRIDSGARAKSDGSPLTLADEAAHHVIVDALRAWTPDVPVVSEEGEIPDASVRQSWRRFWLVDPLDGTKEFLHRNGDFTVNVALVEDGEPVLGVVYAPAIDRCWYAGKSLGAWVEAPDAPPTRVHSTPPAEGAPLVVVESRSHPSEALERWLATVPVARRVPAGSSLKFCLVAEGTADVYPRFGPTMEWDVAAGDCVFRESGIDGPRRSPLTYNKPDLRNGDFVVGL
ncbi:3'(2'),5'-bisphosphate nucleotidase (plasmid) [Gemmatirosa kalamazoonensis]|uniref:3'(2'),5'-bisphosphate nucleotidase CysQ n=1 Tax=Gemmatirosa kalamazoonensis TaxID=861299 RepID=W0RSA2_9BACT|nr:3'(2'),5'-bisphosphate nucleotidase CysQ [Gemmatirosa kalamazoonensis]AHG93581.1 3'(2'),5'-bisphosphate nucleotidase [Gemmatirosa kalamazoonensis]